MAANDTTVGDGYVDIPGRPTFWKTVGLPPIRINFPLESEMRTSFGAFLLFLAAMAFGGLLILVGIAILSAGAPFLIALTAIAVVLTGVLILIGAGSYFVDLVQRGPHLVMDAEGIRDSRLLHSKLQWSDIEEAACGHGRFTDYASLWVRARHPIHANRNPFRHSGFLHLFVRRPERLFIPLGGFRNNRFLGETALAMVRRNGGTVRQG
jgi:hypothetical protein